MPFDFTRKKKQKNEIADDGYRERAKKEQDRRELATDDGYWMVVCFREQSGLDDFRSRFGLPEEKFISGSVLAGATKCIKPETPRRGFAKKSFGSAKADNPLKNVIYTGDASSDAIAEADAVLDALMSVEMPTPCREASDSSIWICAAFESRAAMDEYIAAHNLAKYGDKYMDGDAWMASIDKQ